MKTTILILLSIFFTSCEKEESVYIYGSAIINNESYLDRQIAYPPVSVASPNSLELMPVYGCAQYEVDLEPTIEGRSVFTIIFFLPLDESGEVMLNRSFKLSGADTPSEYPELGETSKYFEDKLVDGYDGIAMYTNDRLGAYISLDGELIIDRYDMKTETYYGSYKLTNTLSSQSDVEITGEFNLKRVVNKWLF